MILVPLDPGGLARLLERPGIRTVLDALRADGEETRLVGGCVRDALLGAPGSDIDLATTLVPDETLRRARTAGLKAVPTGYDHGTITVVVEGAPFETTTLREDIETDGRHATVRFGRDFARDAERRDFTINALSLGADGHLHDTAGGASDLAAGRVRFIGDPATRIREDALRILRFFRFHARYGRGEPDRAGLSAVIAERSGLDRLSRERVRGEVLRLLLAPCAPEAVAIMAEVGLLVRILGTPGDLGRLGRAIASEAMGGLAPDALRRLAALAVFSPEDAVRLETTLRLSRTEAARLRAYAGAAARLHAIATIGPGQMRALAAEHGLSALDEAVAALDGEPRPQIGSEARAVLARFREGSEAAPVFPLAGADLVAAGIQPGPQVGLGLAAARRAWLDQGCPDDPGEKARLLAVSLEASSAT